MVTRRDLILGLIIALLVGMLIGAVITYSIIINSALDIILTKDFTLVLDGDSTNFQHLARLIRGI